MPSGPRPWVENSIGSKNRPKFNPENRPRIKLKMIHTYKLILELQGVPSVRGLGWVDLHFEYFTSTVCSILPGLVGIWQTRLGSWTRWWNTLIKVNPTKVHEGRPRPVYYQHQKGSQSGPENELKNGPHDLYAIELPPCSPRPAPLRPRPP